jgi:hypothetical protein
MVEMELHLPGESSPIQVDGRVARTKTGTADGQTGMGIRFTRVNNDDAGRLKRFFAAHHALNGSRVVIVSDEPFEMRDIARAIAREGLQPQVLRWSDPPPAADPPICAFVVVPSARGQAADFAALRRSYGQFRPGLLIILKDESLTDEWLALASVCIHGMPEPDRAAALTLCVAIPPPPASHVAVG